MNRINFKEEQTEFSVHFLYKFEILFKLQSAMANSKRVERERNSFK